MKYFVADTDWTQYLIILTSRYSKIRSEDAKYYKKVIGRNNTIFKKKKGKCS